MNPTPTVYPVHDTSRNVSSFGLGIGQGTQNIPTEEAYKEVKKLKLHRIILLFIAGSLLLIVLLFLVFLIPMLFRNTCRAVLGALIKGSFSQLGCLYIPIDGTGPRLTNAAANTLTNPKPLTFNMQSPISTFSKSSQVSNPIFNPPNLQLNQKLPERFIISTDTNPVLYVYFTQKYSILGDLALTENREMADHFEFKNNMIYLCKNGKVLKRKNGKVILEDLTNIPVGKRDKLAFWKIENNRIYTYFKDKILYPVTVLDFKGGRTNTVYSLTLSSNKDKDIKWIFIPTT
jgi:hypothetical protein